MRARTLGWPDVYTFTKALGERAVEDLAHAEGLSLSIVRPSIIESALEHPAPGWIDGFKMADPIIRAYGLGQIPEFPGIPEGIVDLIPVDYVVNAILAVAASPPPPGEPAHYNVSSGDRNPLRFFELYEYVREYFEAHPLPERGRGEHKVPEWKFPGTAAVETMLRRAERLTDLAEKVVTHLPKSERMRDAVARVDRDQARVEFVKRYSDLYGMYTETEVVYTDERVVRLWRLALGPRSRAVPVRRRHDRLASLPPGRPLPGGDAEPAGALDNGIASALGSSVRPARRARARGLRHGGHDHQLERRGVLRLDEVRRSRARRVAERAGLGLRRIPGYLQTDRRDRGDFLRTFFRRYEDASVERVDALIDEPRGRVHVAEGVARRAPPRPGAPRRRASHDPHHGRRRTVRPRARSAVRRADRSRARGPRRSLHGVHVRAAAGRRGARGVAPPVRAAGGCRPPALVRVRGLVLRPASAPRGRATRWPCRPTPSCTDTRAAGGGRSRSWAMSRGMPKVRFPRPAAR